MGDLKQHLSGTTIGILGLGYIGTGLSNYFKALSVDIQLIEITRQNYHTVCDHQYDYFFNCAGNTGDFRAKPAETIESNLTTTINLLRSIDIVNAYVGLSSTRVYGFSEDKDKHHDETMSSVGDHLDLEYVYDGSKKLLECLLTNLDSSHKQNIVIARLSNVFDDFSEDELDDATLLKLIIASGKKRQKLEIQQHQSSSKDYIHLNDCLEGIVRAAIYGSGGQIYNIARGQSASLEEISGSVNPLMQFDNSKKASHCTVSIEKAQSKLGFNPIINILEYLAE